MAETIAVLLKKYDNHIVSRLSAQNKNDKKWTIPRRADLCSCGCSLHQNLVIPSKHSKFISSYRMLANCDQRAMISRKHKSTHTIGYTPLTKK
jgi:hypothetical protein